MQHISVILGITAYKCLATACETLPRKIGYSQALGQLKTDCCAGTLNDSSAGLLLFVNALPNGFFPLSADKFTEKAYFAQTWAISYRPPPKRGISTPATIRWQAMLDKELVARLDSLQ